MELFTWPCGCKSPAEGGDVTEPCDDCRADPDEPTEVGPGDNNEPTEPDEEDLVTEDHRRFYSHGGASRLAVEVDEERGWDWQTTVRDWMERNNFYPNVWQLDDHGGFTLLSWDD